MPADTTAVFIQNRGMLVNYATGLVGSRTQAEDLVQEAWLKFNEAASQQRLAEPLHYLFRIIRNLAVDGQRRQEFESRLFKPTTAIDLAEAPDEQPTAEAIAVHKDDLRLLSEVLQELPERTRVAFEMHRFEGCKLREIAAVLEISLSAAQLLVVDGVEHCKQRLGWD